MHRIILRLVEEITNHLVSSSLPLLYVNTQFHISNKQFHIFFQILRCSKMNQDEEQQNVASRAIEDGPDFWKMEHLEDEVEDSTFGEEDDTDVKVVINPISMGASLDSFSSRSIFSWSLLLSLISLIISSF